MTITEKDVTEYLNNISSDIAGKLREAGIKDCDSFPYACPVALLLKKKFPDYRISVWGSTCDLRDNEFGNRFSVECPTDVEDFVDAFDRGDYPEFEKKYE